MGKPYGYEGYDGNGKALKAVRLCPLLIGCPKVGVTNVL